MNAGNAGTATDEGSPEPESPAPAISKMPPATVRLIIKSQPTTVGIYSGVLGKKLIAV